MSARGILSVVGTAVGGVIGLGTPPPPDPDCIRELLTEAGLRPGQSEDELTETVREFQDRAGLIADGVAGPRTVHLLSRYAREHWHGLAA